MTTRFDDACTAAATSLIESITSGEVGDWSVPWHAPGGLVAPQNAATGNVYQGGNWIIAMLEAFGSGWASGYWATYKQWQSLGRQVAKGATGTALVRWVEPKRSDDREPGADADSTTATRRRVPFVFKVFAAEQLVPAPEAHWQPPLADPTDGLDPTQSHRDLDDWIAATGAEITLTGNRAYYVGGEVDTIHLPPHDAWELWGDFYATAAHELIHWTGNETRLARPRITRADTSEEARAFEELIAEFGAAMIGQHFGFTPSPRADHASYLSSWARQLNADSRVLWRAASAAQKSVDHLLKSHDDPGGESTPDLRHQDES